MVVRLHDCDFSDILRGDSLRKLPVSSAPSLQGSLGRRFRSWVIDVSCGAGLHDCALALVVIVISVCCKEKFT